ncbi:MAG: hypothetical protein JWR26_692 [Pedosphaera sp.]|nr:hypothetical protein [Pedosphaera sp.]
MKKTIIAAIIISVLLSALAHSEEITLPHVTVYGTATTEVVPDQMVWSLKIENKGAALDGVARDHSKVVESVLKFLRDAKVDDKAIQTSQMEFGENWEYLSSSRVKAGYYAATSVSFKITDLNLYQTLWFGLSKMPQVSVAAVTYDHTRRIQYQNETRQKAVQAAKEKAASMARALGSEISEPLLVEEDIALESPWSGNNAMYNNVRVSQNDGGAQIESVAPGTIPIKTRVRAAFRLVTSQK